MYRTELFGGEIGPRALPMCRISYAQGLHQSRDNDNGDPRYSVTLIFPKDQIKVLKDAVAECVTEEWGEKGIERFKKGLIKNPILEGDGKSAHDKEGNLKAGMGPDIVFIRASSGRPAKVFDSKGLPMDGKEIRSGWWGYPVLNAYAWHNPQNGDGVSFGLEMWKHAKEDEVLGGDGGGDPAKFYETAATGDNSDVKGGASSLFD